MPKTSKNLDLAETEADFYYALADRARTLRGRSKLTLAKCGEIMGLTESMASLKFKGGNKWSAYEVSVMAEAFNVTAGVLYGDEPMPEPVRPARVVTLDTSKNSKPRHNGYKVGHLAEVRQIRTATGR